MTPRDNLPPTAVAIIGMAGRFPDAADLRAFWRNLCAGAESLTSLQEEDLLKAGVAPELIADPSYVRKGTYLEDAGSFDASFFGFSAREAEIMDPQHRVFLECAWEAFEDAGYVCDRYPGAVGVYAGASINTYIIANLLANPAVLETVGGYQAMIANDKDFLATRVSYKMNLRGPALTVQTACSTSLVAIHVARQSLLDHQCDLALAGGVSISFPEKAGYLYREGMIFSPDGHCRPFDEKGQGIRGGAGAGVVVLKRLAEALADGDQIRAVILGSAVNNDGSAKMGYTAPSMDGQAEVIAMAQAQAGVDPGTITSIEAHGTATPLGDPIEVAALSQVFRAATKRRKFCALGSVKSNIGHLDAAAGVAGLIKAALSLENRMIPPSLNFEKPNPQIDFTDSPFYVNHTLSEWHVEDHPRRAAVSSFGIGGTNAHAVLEEAPEPGPSIVNRPSQLLVLSARTAASLEAASSNLARHLASTPEVPLGDVAYTLQAGRKRFEHRRAIVCCGREEAVAALDGRDAGRVIDGAEIPGSGVALLFSGQGSQHVGMGRDLYQADPTFREEVDCCSEILAGRLGCDIRQWFGGHVSTEDERKLTQTRFAQPALFVLEYALGRMWMSWGIRPTAMMGHSVGEYVAACLSGVFSLEDALQLIVERGRLMQEMPAGQMVAVPLPQAEVMPLLNGKLVLAAVNAPRLCVVAGSGAEVEDFLAARAAQGVECRPLHTSHAFHSPMMDPVLPAFLDVVRGVDRNAPRIPYISNLSGTWISAEEVAQPDYWTRHLRHTVRFAEGLEELARNPDRIFLEVGPGKTLATLARQTLGPSGHPILHSLPHPLDNESGYDVALRALGRLWAYGIDVHWDQVHREERLRRVSLPTYPFQRQRYWVEPQRIEAAARTVTPARNPRIDDWFYAPSWRRSPTPVARGVALTPGPNCWVFFVDRSSVGQQMAQYVSPTGGRCISVQQGDSFTNEGDDYIIDPKRKEHFAQLLESLHERGLQAGYIVHLWNVSGSESMSRCDEVMESSFFDVLHLCQAIGDTGLTEKLRLLFVSDAMHSVLGAEAVMPEKALLLGLSRTIPREYEHISCRSVDIDTAEISRDLIANLVGEAVMDGEDDVVAYRGANRWVQSFERLPLAPPADGLPRLKERGVYLITGGLGGLGLVFARFLAERLKARLVLTSRAGLPPRSDWTSYLDEHDDHDQTSARIRQIRELEAVGAEILVSTADASDRIAMRRLASEARSRFGRIDGIIHAAGLPGGGLIQLRSREDALDILAPKVEGARVLEEILGEAPTDFLILCSSINSILGSAGSADYTAANAFLDAFATAHQDRKTHVLSVNWDTWQEVGMAVNTEVPASLREARQADVRSYGIRPTEGIDALCRVLQTSLPQVAVITRDFEQLGRLSRQSGDMSRPASPPPSGGQEPVLGQHSRPELSGSYVEPESDAQRTIAAIWRELLGLDQVGIDDNFFELGGHSLLATGLMSRIQKEFSVTLQLRLIFEAPTVRELADRIQEIAWATQPAPMYEGGRDNREEFEI